MLEYDWKRWEKTFRLIQKRMKNVGFFGPTEYHFWKPPCKWPFFRCQNPISKYHHLSPGELLCQNLDFEMERFCKKENPSCLRWKNFLLEKSFFFRNFFEKKYYFAQKIDQKSSIDRFPQPIRKSLQCFEAPNCFKFLEGPLDSGGTWKAEEGQSSPAW